jgi:hypothetical protein
MAITTTYPFVILGRNAQTFMGHADGHSQAVAALARDLIAGLEAEEVASLAFVVKNGTTATVYQRTHVVRDTWKVTDAAVMKLAEALGSGAQTALSLRPHGRNSIVDDLTHFRRELLQDHKAYATVVTAFTRLHGFLHVAMVQYLRMGATTVTPPLISAMQLSGALQAGTKRSTTVTRAVASTSGAIPNAAAALSAAYDDMRRKRSIDMAEALAPGGDFEGLRQSYSAPSHLDAHVVAQDVSNGVRSSVNLHHQSFALGTSSSGAIMKLQLNALLDGLGQTWPPPKRAGYASMWMIGLHAVAVAILFGVAGVLGFMFYASPETATDGQQAQSVHEMNESLDRVNNMMTQLSTFQLPDEQKHKATVKALEGELQQLHLPTRVLYSHLPPMIRANAKTSDLASQLDCGLQSCPQVTLAVVDAMFLSDAPITDKSLPVSLRTLRVTIEAEATRRGAVMVMSPCSKWTFAWNLSTVQHSGPYVATVFAQSIIEKVGAEFPSLRICICTGPVVYGVVGSTTMRSSVVFGAPLTIARSALQIAASHNVALIVDADTHAHVAAHMYRAKPVEVVAAEPTGPKIVLYDLLSNLDKQDGQMMRWCGLFEKYRAGNYQEAATLLVRWREKTKDDSSERLLKLMTARPPQTVTIGDIHTASF